MESNADPVVVEMQNIPAQAKPTARPKSGGVTDIVIILCLYLTSI